MIADLLESYSRICTAGELAVELCELLLDKGFHVIVNVELSSNDVNVHDRTTFSLVFLRGGPVFWEFLPFGIFIIAYSFSECVYNL